MEKKDFYIDMKGLVSGNDGPPFTSIDRSIKNPCLLVRTVIWNDFHKLQSLCLTPAEDKSTILSAQSAPYLENVNVVVNMIWAYDDFKFCLMIMFCDSGYVLGTKKKTNPTSLRSFWFYIHLKKTTHVYSKIVLISWQQQNCCKIVSMQWCQRFTLHSKATKKPLTLILTVWV